jgi:hypothetical protein
MLTKIFNNSKTFLPKNNNLYKNIIKYNFATTTNIDEETRELQEREGFKRFTEFMLERKNYYWRDYQAQILVI